MASSVRVGLSVTPEVLEQIDAYATKMGISRSSAFSVLAMQALNGNRGLEAIAAMWDTHEEQKKGGRETAL